MSMISANHSLGKGCPIILGGALHIGHLCTIDIIHIYILKGQTDEKINCDGWFYNVL